VRRRNKRNTVSKEIVKISLFADDMIIYFKDPKKKKSLSVSPN
jgi:hypothetical protein